MLRYSRHKDVRPVIVGGLAATLLIFAYAVHAQAGASVDRQKEVIGEDGAKQSGIVGEDGLKKAAEAQEIVKAPDGNFYRLTPAQLKGMAASDDKPPPPCKKKDCLIISAYGKQLQVPLKDLAPYKISPTVADQQIKSGTAPLPAAWPPPISP
jgi:hypothetical protein